MKITSCFSRGFPATRRLVMRRPAFTRVELLACILAFAGLGLLVRPALGASASRSRLTQCFNNLRQVGAGFQSWAMSNGDKFPWQVRKADGGLNGSSLSGNPFIHFAIISNELVTPRVLVCPSDSGKKPASDFGASSAGGILHNNFQNLAVSYMVGLHGAPDLPQQILSGDRHLKVSGAQHCAVVGVPAMALMPNDTSIGWTNLHNATGNLLFSDGSVQTLSSTGLRQAILGAAPPVSGSSPQTHVLVPGFPPTLPE